MLKGKSKEGKKGVEEKTFLEMWEVKEKLNKFFGKKNEKSLKDSKNLSQKFLCSTFDGSDKIERIEFILKNLKSEAALEILQKMEGIVEELVDNLDQKLKTPLYKLPLSKIAEKEGSKLPLAIELLCQKISERLDKEKEGVDHQLYSLGKEEKTLCESFIKFFQLGSSYELDLDEISLPVLLLVLKTILESLNTPLFTDLISELILVKKNFEQLENSLKSALSLVPECNLQVIACVCSTLKKLLDSCKTNKSKLNLSNMFLPSFISQEYDEDFEFAILALHFLIINFPRFQICPDFEKQKSNEYFEVSTCSPLGPSNLVIKV